MSTDILKKNNVKPILSQREKKRYHQISEQFFRGAGTFFVLYNESINKSVDDQIIKGQFMEYYEDQIKKVKDNIQAKQDNLASQKTKKQFFNKLLNFIIILEVGVISATKLPFKFYKIGKNMEVFMNDFLYIGNKLKNGTMEGLDYITDVYGLNFNPTRTLQFVVERIEPFIYDSYENLIYGLDYLFNNIDNNPFLMWLNEIAKVCGTAAGGLIGLIMSLFGLGGYTAASKRHNLMHFLRYGSNPYSVAQSYEDEIQKSVDSAQDGTSWWRPFSSDASIGYEWSTGGWQGLDDDDDGNELPEVKRILSSLQESRVFAAEKSNETYRKASIFGAPDIFNTTGYRDMVQMWNTNKDKSFDLGGLTPVNFHHLLINSSLTNTEQLSKSLSKVGNFYVTNVGTNPHPYAKRICEEIEKYDLLNYNQRLRRGEKAGHYTIEQFIFLPVILYAIMQYEHTQKRDIALIRMYDQNMRQNDILLTVRKKSYGSTEYKKIMDDYKNGMLSTEDVIKKLLRLFDFKEPLFGLRTISYDDIFSSFHDFYDSMVDTNKYINRSLSYLVYGTYEENFNFKSLTIPSEKDDNGNIVYHDEEAKVHWKSIDLMMNDIKDNYVYLKNDIYDALKRRSELFEYFCEIVDFLEPQVLYPDLKNYDE